MPVQRHNLVSEELRRAGVAASTIREALSDWFKQEEKRIIAELAQCPATLEAMLKVKASAIAFHSLDNQLAIAAGLAGEDK